MDATSPFNEYLASNSPPRGDDIPALRQHVEQLACENAALEAKRLQLQQELAAIAEQCEHKAATLAAHGAIISPLRRLNLKLLQRIFSHCLPADRDPTISPFDPPMVLTRVCSKWRAAALESKPLWASLYIHLPAFKAPGGDQGRRGATEEHDRALAAWTTRMHSRRRIVTAWLARAGDHPLSLSIGEAQPSASQTPAETAAFIKLLQKYAAQWLRLELLTSAAFAHALLATASPSLAYLKIDSPAVDTKSTLQALSSLAHTMATMPWLQDRQEEPDLMPLPPVGAPGAPPPPSPFPALHTWFVRRLPRRDILRYPIDWANLTALHFEGYSTAGREYVIQRPFHPADALQLLRATPRLRTCCLHLENSCLLPNTVGRDEMPVVLAQLDHLGVEDGTMPAVMHSDAVSEAFFQRLRCPALRSLTYRLRAGPRNDTDPPPVHDFAIACAPHLRSLAIDYEAWPTSDPLRTLLKRANDTLEELWLSTTLPSAPRGGPGHALGSVRGHGPPGFPREMATSLFIPDLSPLRGAAVPDGAARRAGAGTRKFPQLRRLYYAEAGAGAPGEGIDAKWVYALVAARRSRPALAAGIFDVYLADVEVAFAGARPAADRRAPAGDGAQPLSAFRAAYARLVVPAGARGPAVPTGTELEGPAGPEGTPQAGHEQGRVPGPRAPHAPVDLGPHPATFDTEWDGRGPLEAHIQAARRRAVRSGSLALIIRWRGGGAGGVPGRDDPSVRRVSPSDTSRMVGNILGGRIVRCSDGDVVVNYGAWAPDAAQDARQDHVLTETGARMF